MTSQPQESILITLGGRASAGEQIGARWSGKWKKASYSEILPFHRYRKELRKSGFPTGCRPKFRVILELLRSVGAVSLCTDWRQTAVATALVIDTGVWGGGVKFGSVSRNIPGGERERDGRNGGKETETISTCKYSLDIRRASRRVECLTSPLKCAKVCLHTRCSYLMQTQYHFSRCQG